MGTLADSLFNVLMSWVRALVNSLWAMFTSDKGTILEFFGQNWIGIVAVILICGLVMDWLIWLIRWRPYHLWAIRIRRLLHLPDPQQENTHRTKPVQAAVHREPETVPDEAKPEDLEEEWIPLEQPVIEEQEAQEVLRQAQSVPDEALGAYPGMRYGVQAVPRSRLDETQQYAAVHSEGPGAAEVNRRRAEIDAWKNQMQEEARSRAQAEQEARRQAAYEAEQAKQAQAAYEAEQEKQAQAAYETEQAKQAQAAYETEQAKQAQAAYEAEQARQAQAAYEAEQAKQAQAAYEAEQARLAQEEYERQFAEYERQKAEYEQQLAAYERQKAEYDAAMAQQEQSTLTYGQEDAVQSGMHRRRALSYSSYAPQETVETLPDPPQWPQIDQQMHREQPAARKSKPRREGKLLRRMSKIIEPEEEDISSIAALPPRVDAHDAYRPPATPEKSGKRKR